MAGFVLVAAAVAFAAARLDEADKWGSVVGGLAGVAGLALTAFGVAGARRPVGQAIENTDVGGGVVQVRGVSGSVHIGHAPVPPAVPFPPRPRPAVPPPHSGGNQRVSGSSAAGPIRQVDGVGGDVEIDRWD